MPVEPETATRAASISSPPSYFSSALRVFELSMAEMLWSRRTIFMALVVGGPVLIAAFVRILSAAGLGGFRVNSVQVGGPTIFGLMIWVFYLRFSVPVLGVFYGTALVADEVEDKTITYLFTRPISRRAILFGKYLAYLACTGFVVLPSVVLVYLLIVPLGGGTLGSTFVPLLVDLGLLALGLAVYGAVFALVGTALKRPLLIGLMFIFAWEPAMLLLPGYMRRFTVAYYLQALVPHAMPQDTAISTIQAIFRDHPPPAASLGWLALVGVACLALAGQAIERREYVLEQ